jgi:hypothetical protein
MSNVIHSMFYAVWDSGTKRTGSAEDILGQIRQNAARDNKELQEMTVDDYAAALVADAQYYIPKKILDSLESQDFPTPYDRALAYLCATPSSRVRILSQRN